MQQSWQRARVSFSVALRSHSHQIMSSLSSSGWSGPLKAAVLGLLGLALAWEVVSRSYPAYLAELAPATALRLRPTEATALLQLADATLNAALARSQTTGAEAATTDTSEPGDAEDDRVRLWAGFAKKALQSSQATASEDHGSLGSAPAITLDPQTRAQVRASAQLVLANDPLNAGAMRILGQVATDDNAAKLMQAAVRRSIRESIAVYWLMLDSAKKGDDATAIHYADVLLRTRGNSLPLVLPTLAHAAESDAHDALETLLASNPPWRRAAFAALLPRVSDSRTPLTLLLAMKNSPNPPTPADLRSYIDFLLSRKNYDLAYYTWLQFLPPEQLRSVGYLFNGSFELPLSGLPFDWTFGAGSGVTIDIAPRTGLNDQHALFLEFGEGRVDFRGVSQWLMLPPGSYQLKGLYRGSIRGRRGLTWRIKCAGAHTPVGESPMMLGTTLNWKELDIAFRVPDVGCPAQRLQLELDARSASEQLVSGSAWYDELAIARTDAAPDSSTPQSPSPPQSPN
jgi:hypothetical protein